jgi:predicted DNA-binding transcriptional regulator YafY
MRRADRLIGIVHFLRAQRQAVTAARIGEAFEICARTVYRDVQDLMTSGVPISGEAGVGYVIDKRFYLPPIAFDRDEMEAIALGISMVRQWTDARFADRADSALARIQAVLPAPLQGELQQVTTYARPTAGMPPWQDIFSPLRESIRARRKVDILYTDLQDIRSARRLHPLALVFFSPVWLLAAWCELRGDFRTFRLDRITGLQDAGEGFADTPGRNLAAYRAREPGC